MMHGGDKTAESKIKEIWAWRKKERNMRVGQRVSGHESFLFQE